MSDEIYINVDEDSSDIIVQVAEFDKVLSVNAEIGHVIVDKTTLGLNNVENVSIVATSGHLQNQINNIAVISDIVYTTGSQTINGLKDFTSRPTVNGSGVLLSGEQAKLPNTLVYTTGFQIISGIKKFKNDIEVETINNNTSFGIYNFAIKNNHYNKYNLQQNDLQLFENTVSGIRNKDIVNLYFSDDYILNNGVESNYSRTLKVNPGVLVDHGNAISSRNLIKFSDNGLYSGKAIRKIRYNSTIGNGYERILLSEHSYSLDNCPIIKPKTRRLETFYDIEVPSGQAGETRYIKFEPPTSFPFVQGLCLNLRFNFQADSNPCTISGVASGSTINEHVFTLTGASYDFIQKERVILISKQDGLGNGNYEFKHW